MTTLVGYHHAKTGGTTLLSHALSVLGDGEVFGYGPYAAANRFFAGEPLFEELSPGEQARLRFVFGHGVDFPVAARLGEQAVLFCVCRDPVELFVSSYKHELRTNRQAAPASAREHFARQPASPFATAIRRHFPALGGDAATALGAFKHVLATERLNAMAAPLFAEVGVEGPADRKRVYEETADLGDVTAEEILARDALDAEIHAAVVAASDAGRPHPFGFAPGRLEAAMRAAALPVGEAAATTGAYEALFDHLRADGRLEAAKVFADRGGGRPRAREALAAYLESRRLTLDLETMAAPSWIAVAEVLRKAGDTEGEAQAIASALKADPANPRARFLAGRAAVEAGEAEAGAAHLEASVATAPRVPESWFWLARAAWKQRRLDRAAEAITEARALNRQAAQFAALEEKIAAARGKARR